MDPLKKARAAKEKVKEIAASIPEVNGIGITMVGETYAVRVSLSRALDDPAAIPASIEGVTIICRVVGRLRAQDE